MSFRRPRLLLVDDEPALLRAYARRLGRRCDVTTETDGVQAIARLQAGEPFDLVLCDLSMRAAGGTAVHRAAFAADSEFAGRFYVMTGGAFAQADDEYLATHAVQVLDKPISLKVLDRIVDELIADKDRKAAA